MTVIASATFANGLIAEFRDTYTSLRNRQADSRLSLVMDLPGITLDNRRKDAAYYKAAPHMRFWPRGGTVPQKGFASVLHTMAIHEFALKISWLKWDRDDDQIQGMMATAKDGGASSALNPERFFFQILTGGADLLPNTPTCPDGAALFSTTDGGGGNRFGVSSGNLLTGTGIATTGAIQTDYYTAIKQFMMFEDGEDQPALSPETIASGVVIICSAADIKIFEEAFLQLRQGVVLEAGTNDVGATPSNIIKDASRNVELWPTPRLATGDWYVFLRNAPKKPVVSLHREGLQEFTALMQDNNSDLTRATAEESVQWYLREGATCNVPFGAIKVNN